MNREITHEQLQRIHERLKEQVKQLGQVIRKMEAGKVWELFVDDSPRGVEILKAGNALADFNADCREFIRNPQPAKGESTSGKPKCDDVFKAATDEFLTQQAADGSPLWQLALYDPCDPDEPPIHRSRMFGNSQRDRRYMAEVIRGYNRRVSIRDDIYLNLGVFAAEIE